MKASEPRSPGCRIRGSTDITATAAGPHVPKFEAAQVQIREVFDPSHTTLTVIATEWRVPTAAGATAAATGRRRRLGLVVCASIDVDA